jgi:hypothetical protein
MFGAGLSLREVGEAVGVSDSAVAKALRAAGVGGRRSGSRRRLTADQEHDARLLHARGHGLADIADHFGVTPPTIRAVLDRTPAAGELSAAAVTPGRGQAAPDEVSGRGVPYGLPPGHPSPRDAGVGKVLFDGAANG